MLQLRICSGVAQLRCVLLQEAQRRISMHNKAAEETRIGKEPETPEKKKHRYSLHWHGSSSTPSLPSTVVVLPALAHNSPGNNNHLHNN